MKNISGKNIVPHVIAIGVFLLVAVIYCSPVLQGKVLPQHDLAQWVGMNKDQQNYYDANGHYPLWTNGMFSGMPGYMISGYSNNSVPGYFITLLSLFLPAPINFFFLACICFYFLSQVLKIKPWIGIAGALAYAYATYNPIIITVGHVTKMYSIALMPGLIGSLHLIFNKKYWVGTALSALFASALVAESHYQIVYYTLIIIVFMTGAFIIRCIRERHLKHMTIALTTATFAGIIGVASSAVSLLPNYEYTKETIRGGSQLVAATPTDSTKIGTGGLNEDYAFSYSLGITEPFVMMVPRMFGGSSGRPEISEEKSKAIEALRNMPRELAQQLGYPSYYWGGIDGVGTSGPPYAGAIICFLAIVGFVIADKKYKWWILSCSSLAIIMSWGGYFKDFNRLLLEYLPLYNKFRAPSMIIVIPTLLFGIMTILTLDKIIYGTKDLKSLIQPYKKALLIFSVIIALLFLLYISFDYLGDTDKQILKQVSSMQQEEIKTPVKNFITGLAEDRRSLFLGDLLRSLFFIATAAVTIWLYLKAKIKSAVAISVIGLFSFIDIISIDIKYMSSDDFVTKDEYSDMFVPSAADNQIMQDKSFYRVLDLRQGIRNTFNSGALTAYFHKSIGGYHPAKLSIYQDLIDSQLYKFPNCMPVVNMLNTKYVIGQNGQAQQNPMALGNAWFVKSVVFKKDSKEVMHALDNLNTKDTAVAENISNTVLKNVTNPDSTAVIQMIGNHNDTVNYKSKSVTEQIAVFSEIYYDKGWNAYIDGKKVPYAKVNYVLRGMMIPAGEHTIEYRFEPESHALGWKITGVCAAIMIITLLIAIFMEFRKKRQFTQPLKQM